LSQRCHEYSSLLRRYAVSTGDVTAGDKVLRSLEMSVTVERSTSAGNPRTLSVLPRTTGVEVTRVGMGMLRREI